MSESYNELLTLRARVAELEGEKSALIAHGVERLTEIARLREALTFYSSQWKSYCGDHGVPIGTEPTEALLADRGETAKAALAADSAPSPKVGLYFASKTVHAGMWRAMRKRGVPIISTWIDEAEPGQTSDWIDLWSRCFDEPKNAAAVVLYRRPEEVLKGAWIEVGVALDNGVPVYAVGANRASIRHHPLFIACDSLQEAIDHASTHLPNTPAEVQP